MFAMIISQRDALTAECIGADDVCSGLQITPVDIGYHIGAGEREHIIIALHLPLDVGKQIAPEILLLQPIRLNHSAHGTIKYQYVTERLFQSARGFLPFAHLLLVIYLAHSLLFSLSPLGTGSNAICLFRLNTTRPSPTAEKERAQLSVTLLELAVNLALVLLLLQALTLVILLLAPGNVQIKLSQPALIYEEQGGDDAETGILDLLLNLAYLLAVEQ